MSSVFSESVFILPDILAQWPWKRNINPLSGSQVKAEATAWIQSFNAFTPHLQRAFDLGDNRELASLLKNDEFTDIATPHGAQEMARIVMDAIHNPDKTRTAGECVIGEATRQFWKSSSKYASAGARHRLIEAIDKFTASVAQQAQDRALNYIRNIDEYFLVRRDTIGAMPAFAVLEFRLDLPAEVFEDPVIQRLTNVCVDMIILSNDICSYNVEQARGDDGHNLVTILMHHKNLGLNEAMEWIGDHASTLVHNFLNDLNHVPSFGEEIQGQVERYLDGMGNWVRANDCWHFEGGRYFAEGGLEIQKSRKVVLQVPQAMPHLQIQN
ncbi:hypothetical protein C0995_010633 [Termitomyces sp. Mi166|nr:hypothetical protein C0995_010633 [Termitomyces sp. Mi166\